VLEAHRQGRKRIARPRPDDAVIAARKRLWAQYVLLDVAHRGRITCLAFAVRYRLGDPGEFRRFFSAGDKRGIPEGSGPAIRFYRALHEAIAERRQTLSHGRVADSHLAAAPLQ
jgi:hypothetical protein